jgi:hypothetical protein
VFYPSGRIGDRRCRFIGDDADAPEDRDGHPESNRRMPGFGSHDLSTIRRLLPRCDSDLNWPQYRGAPA